MPELTDREITERLALECLGLPTGVQSPTGLCWWADASALYQEDGNWFSPLTDDGDTWRCVEAMEARGWFMYGLWRSYEWTVGLYSTCGKTIQSHRDRLRAIALVICDALDAEKADA